MTHVPLSLAKAQLTDLVRRAEEGERIVLTRHGREVVRLAPIEHFGSGKTREEKLRIIHEIQESAKGKFPPDFNSARAADFLYGDDGLPG
jgi:prevent-host-death family protein